MYWTDALETLLIKTNLAAFLFLFALVVVSLYFFKLFIFCVVEFNEINVLTHFAAFLFQY